MTTKEFIKKAIIRHGNYYDYSKVNYINSREKVCIICPEHGEFWQSPSKHLYGQNCPKCAMIFWNNKKQELAKEKFIRDAKIIFGDKFDYSKVNYIDQKTKVEIICPIHGSFWIKPDNFLRNSSKNRYGCQKCAKNHRYTLEEWKVIASKVHNNFYTYDKIREYSNSHNKVIITCPKHGDFLQSANSHIQGCGCPKCNLRKSQNILYERLKKDLQIPLEFDYHIEWLGRQHLDIYSKKYNFAIEFNGPQHYQPTEYFGGRETFIKIQALDAIKKEKCASNNCPLFVLDYGYTEDNYQTLLQLLKQLINKEG